MFEEYDVLALPNLYGDVLDLCAGMIGGLGMAPGATMAMDALSSSRRARLRAEVRRPEQGVNPMAQLLSGMLMLRLTGEDEAADNSSSARSRT